jgi:uncharacterized surface protein with fasciclin (FAS1) repeats
MGQRNPHKPERKFKDMRKAFATMALAVLGIVGATTVYSAPKKTTMVGGQAMYPSKDIVDNAVNSVDHTTLVAAVKAAGLVETLKGPGPFTVFAPVNSAFAKLPQGMVESLLKPENHDTLVKILTYHVVPGRQSTAALRKQIREGHGQATLKTVSGGTLTLMMNGEENIIIKDEKGDAANLTISNVYQSNGVIQVIDTVLLPN